MIILQILFYYTIMTKGVRAPMATTGTILYVEDNQDNRTLVRRILQSEGFQVIEAEDADDCYAGTQWSSPRPDFDGYQPA